MGYSLNLPNVALTETIPVDECGLLLFLRLLSQLYQGLGPIDPPPYYELEAIEFTDPLKTPSPIPHLYDPSTPPSWEYLGRKAMDFVTFRLTATQLTEIHTSVIEDTRMSGVDSTVGLLALCLSEVEPESKPIDTISYVIKVSAFIRVL